jgi:Predicted pPIWI-associating nuclease
MKKQRKKLLALSKESKHTEEQYEKRMEDAFKPAKHFLDTQAKMMEAWAMPLEAFERQANMMEALMGPAKRMRESQVKMMEAWTGPLETFERQANMIEALMGPANRIRESQAKMMAAWTGPSEAFERQANMMEALMGPAKHFFDTQAEMLAAFKGPAEAYANQTKMLEGFFDHIDNLSLSLKASLFSQQKLFNIGSNAIGKIAKIKEKDSSILRNNFDNMLFSYKDYFDSIKQEKKIAERHYSNIEFATIEVLNAAILAEATTIKKEQEEDEKEFLKELELSPKTVKKLLSIVDKELVETYEEAVEAFSPGRKYRGRQISTALRTIFDELLKRLAPKEKCIQWLEEKNNEKKKGRLIRRERLSYIFREINEKEFNEFIKNDIEGALGFLVALNKGVHALKSYEDDIINKALFQRMNCLFYYIINASEKPSLE